MSLLISIILVFFAILTVYAIVKGTQIMFREMRGDSPYKSGVKTGGRARLAHNRRGEHLIYHSNGSISTDINALLRNPKVQDDIRAAGRLYKMMVLKALYTGEEPPRQYGDFLPMNKERLLAEWDEDWQAVMDDVGLDYNKFFNIKPKELTAEEIAAEYVEKDKKEGIGESTFRRYVNRDRSLRL